MPVNLRKKSFGGQQPATAGASIGVARAAARRLTTPAPSVGSAKKNLGSLTGSGVAGGSKTTSNAKGFNAPPPITSTDAPSGMKPPTTPPGQAKKFATK